MHGAIYFTGAVPQVDKRRNESPPTEAALFADCKIDQRRSARSRPWSRQDYEAQMLTNEEFASLLRVRNAAVNRAAPTIPAAHLAYAGAGGFNPEQILTGKGSH